MAENLRVTIELAAIDNGSKVLNVAFDKIAGKAASTAAKVSKTAFDISKKAAVIGGLIAAPLAYGANQAIKFEDAMAGVSKVAGKGYEVASKGLENLATSAKKSAVELGIGADSSAELMASLASGGVLVKDLNEMTSVAGKIGIAFDMAAKDAGDSFVKMRNALGTTNAEAKKAADSFNFISDNDASTAAQVLAYMANGGASVARSLSIAAPKAAVFGSALISMGKSGEEAGTIMTRFQKALYLKDNADMLATYQKAGRGAAGLMAVLKTGANIKNPDAQLKYFLRMGEYGTSISQLAKSYGVLDKNMKLVSNPANYKDSVQKEFDNRNSTTGGQLRRLKSEAAVLAIDLGTVLLPVIRDLVKEVAPLIRQFGEWIKKNPGLTVQLVKGAAAASALSFAVSGIAGAVGGAAKAIDVFNTLKIGSSITSGLAGMRNRGFEATFKLYERFPKLGEALYKFGGRLSSIGAIGARVLPFLATAAQGVGVAIAGITWPVALAIAAVIALGVVIYKNWDKIRPVLVNTWRTIKNIAVGTWDTIAFYVGKIWDAFTTKFTWVKSAIAWVKSAIAGIKMPEWLKSVGNWFGGIGSSIANGARNAANNSADFANAAAARRGMVGTQLGAVDNVARSAARSLPAPALRVSGAVRGGGARTTGLPTPTAPGRGGSTTVDARLTVNLPPGTSASDTRQFEKLLDKHAKKITSIVKEGERRKSAATL